MSTTTTKMDSGSGLKGKRRRQHNSKMISACTIRKLARRGGITRMSHLIYNETRAILKAYLTKIIRNALYLTKYYRRKMVTAEDVVQILQFYDSHTVHGFQTK